MELKQPDGLRAIDQAAGGCEGPDRASAENTRFEIAFFDHAVHPLFPPVAATAKSGKVRLRLRAGAAREARRAAGMLRSDRLWRSDPGMGPRRACQAPDGPRKLHVFTDFQQSGLAWARSMSCPKTSRPRCTTSAARPSTMSRSPKPAPARWLRPDEQTAVHVTIYWRTVHDGRAAGRPPPHERREESGAEGTDQS